MCRPARARQKRPFRFTLHPPAYKNGAKRERVPAGNKAPRVAPTETAPYSRTRTPAPRRLPRRAKRCPFSRPAAPPVSSRRKTSESGVAPAFFESRILLCPIHPAFACGAARTAVRCPQRHRAAASFAIRNLLRKTVRRPKAQRPRSIPASEYGDTPQAFLRARRLSNAKKESVVATRARHTLFAFFAYFA